MSEITSLLSSATSTSIHKPRPSVDRRRRRRLRLCNPSKPLEPSPTRQLLKHYALLGSTLAQNGNLREFLNISKSLLTSDAIADDSAVFRPRIKHRMVARGVTNATRDGEFGLVLEFLSEAKRMGFCLSALFDKEAVEVLGAECGRLLRDGRVVEFVKLMEVLGGYQFAIKDMIKPEYALKKIVDKGGSDLAIRWILALQLRRL